MSTISGFISRFVERPARNKKAKEDRASVMGLFNDYLANYGEVASNVEKAPLIVTAPISDLRPGHVGQFPSWFVIQKVIDREKGHYAPVLREFVQWLIGLGAVAKTKSKELLEAVECLQGEPERCETLTKLLYDFSRRDMPTYA
ncbi:MAG: hypothetical protein ABIG68_07490 [Acidobacteriota bacterium]